MFSKIIGFLREVILRCKVIEIKIITAKYGFQLEPSEF
jgi:hypothetical protein